MTRREVVIALLLAIAVFGIAFSYPVRAEEERATRTVTRYCNDVMCMVSLDDYEWLIANIRVMEAKLTEYEKKPPRCAELEVTEPSKAPKPPPMPKIPREADS